PPCGAECPPPRHPLRPLPPMWRRAQAAPRPGPRPLSAPSSWCPACFGVLRCGDVTPWGDKERTCRHYTARTRADVTSAAEVSGRNRVGYDCFPLADARLDLLEKSPRTAKDLECPHGVQLYDVVIDGKQRPRNGWIYERPRPEMKAVAD